MNPNSGANNSGGPVPCFHCRMMPPYHMANCAIRTSIGHIGWDPGYTTPHQRPTPVANVVPAVDYERAYRELRALCQDALVDARVPLQTLLDYLERDGPDGRPLP